MPNTCRACNNTYVLIGDRTLCDKCEMKHLYSKMQTIMELRDKGVDEVPLWLPLSDLKLLRDALKYQMTDHGMKDFVR